MSSKSLWSGCLVLGLSAAGWLPARADAIDGTWCAPDGRGLAIDGTALALSSGKQLSGDYACHSFACIAPDGKPHVGGEVYMVLLSDHLVRVAIAVADQTEAWNRCQFNS